MYAYSLRNFYYHIVLSSIHKLFYYDFIYTVINNSHIHIDLDGSNAGPAHSSEAPKSNSRGIGGIFELRVPEEKWRILSQKQLFFASNVIDVISTCEKRDVGVV